LHCGFKEINHYLYSTSFPEILDHGSKIAMLPYLAPVLIVSFPTNYERLIMYCTRCGSQVAEADRFCEHCGTSLTGTPGPYRQGYTAPGLGTGSHLQQSQESVLLSFGPFGVDISNGSYSIWRWHRRHSTTVELTNLRILGIANTRMGIGKLVPIIKTSRMPPASFDIPYASIISVRFYPHPLNFGMMKVLDIRYRVGDRIAETSICYFNLTMERAYNIIRGYAPPETVT
jgi:zinc-ribbon domain